MPENSSLVSPEGILMLCVAGILDLTGLIFLFLIFFGIDDYGLLDIIGFFVIGGWMFMKGHSIMGSLKKLLLVFGVELIPGLGGASPSWIILVYHQLKNND